MTRQRAGGPRVAVLRSSRLPAFVTWPVPDEAALYSDDAVLVRELAARGAHAESVAWDEPGRDWGAFDIAVIRSTFDYIDDVPAFLAALDRMERAGCRVLNPMDVVRWNADKSYLTELAKRGVPVVPTWLGGAAAAGDVAAALDAMGAAAAIVKPAVGGGGSGVRRVPVAAVGTALAPGLLAQPLVPAIATEGEWSFIYIDRQPSHTLLKRPASGDFRVQSIYGGTLRQAPASAADQAAADAILAAVPFDLLYARLDLVRLDGRLAVMELEFIEPILSFDLVPEAAGRLAVATLARLERPSRTRPE